MPETASEAWARCEPYIAAALAHTGGTHGVDDIAALVESGDAHFWPGERAAVVTEFMTSPRIKTLNFWLLGGDARELMRMREGIEAWALEQGCCRAIGGGVHKGWARLLGRFGYRAGWTIYVKELQA